MKRMIAGIFVVTGVTSAFVMWCCVRAGAMYDRMNGMVDDVNETTENVKRIIGDTDDCPDLDFEYDDEALGLEAEKQDICSERCCEYADEYVRRMEALHNKHHRM